MPPPSQDDPFGEGDSPRERRHDVADVTSRILAKHAALKSGRSAVPQQPEPPPAVVPPPPSPTPVDDVAPPPEVVLGIMVANSWILPERLEEVRECFRSRVAAPVLRKRGGISSLLVERGILTPPHARELELTLLDQGIFPRYRITKLLGQGLVGRTYVALDISSGIDVAFKVFRQPDAGMRERFIDEFAALARVRNRRVAQALACGSHGEVCFTSSTLVEGERLSRMIGGRHIRSEVQAVRIAQQVAEGLAYVYVYTKMCHLAVRPENVLVNGQDGSSLAAVITDFGVSEQIPAYRSVDNAWRAPESASGAGDLRSDIYAVGAILYGMLRVLGQPGEGGEDQDEVDLTRFHPLVRDLVIRATRPDPLARYPDYRSFIAALSHAVRELGYIEVDEPPPVDRSAAGGLGTRMLRVARKPGGINGDEWVD